MKRDHHFLQGVQRFYGNGESRLFEALLEGVTRQAIIPFFRRRLHRSGRVLDAGSGSGFLSDALGVKRACFIDLTRAQIRLCRDRIGHGSFIQGDLNYLPFRNGSFDTVLCSNVLHYTGLDGLKELLRVTKKGGQLFLSFLEDSDFTRAGIRTGVAMGVFPPMMLDAPLVDLSGLYKLDVRIRDSVTIVFLPPIFHPSRVSPRRGLIAFELEK